MIKITSTLKMILMLALSTSTCAELVSLQEGELGDVTGQAFVSMETYKSSASSQQNLEFTRLNLGLNVDAFINAGKVQLGKYNRAGEKPGTADIDINDLALGYVKNTGSASQPVYEVDPFKIENPYLDFAYDGDELAGFRLGFGGAQGVLSGGIESLTGNIKVSIDDPDGPAGLDIHTEAVLADGHRYLDADGNPTSVETSTLNPNYGQRDNIRSRYVGVPNGVTINVGGTGILDTVVSDCIGPLNKHTCFALSQYESLPIGGVFTGSEEELKDGHQKFVATEMARGVFLAFSSQSIDWSNVPGGEDFVIGTKGAFANIPSGLSVTLDQAEAGFGRILTCLNGARTGSNGAPGC